MPIKIMNAGPEYPFFLMAGNDILAPPWYLKGPRPRPIARGAQFKRPTGTAW